MKTNVISADFEGIPFPKNYQEGHLIAPLEVIESWALNHHLACALTHIARASREDHTSSDIYKAIWYLERFIRRGIIPTEAVSTEAVYRPCAQHIDCHDIAQDWCLNSELSMALEHLYCATKKHPIYHIERAIKCLKHLSLNTKRRQR